MSAGPILSCEQVREIDRLAIDELQMPGLVLMENAGRGIVDLLRQEGVRGPVLIACGPGNNGGDGLVIARHLDLLDIPVHVVLACDPTHLRGDAADNFRWLQATQVTVHRVDASGTLPQSSPALAFDWVVDALLGTGVRGAPRAPLDQMIRQLNQIPARRLAVDLPSGLDGETGWAAPTTFQADVTGTLVAVKPGLVVAQAAPFVGRLVVLDIGVPRGILQRFGLGGRRR